MNKILIKLTFTLLILTLSLSAESQSDKRDYVWIFGHDSRPPAGIESFRFDFNAGSSPDSIKGLSPLSFGGNNASICDKDGNLLYYTNGCHIAGADYQILPNGSELNPGPFITEFLMDTCSDYRSIQEVMFLDDPGVLGSHYLLHKTIVLRENQNSYMDLKYTYIDGSLNNGIGDVTTKNNRLFSNDTKFLFSYTTAINKSNSRDWWIVSLLEDNLIYIISLDSSGFRLVKEIILETDFGEDSSGGGTAKFSPDGTRFAFHNYLDDLHIYDFDRETGEMTNHRCLNVTDERNFSALEWSPNSCLLYTSPSPRDRG